MERCAYVINTTPSYFYLLRLHLTLLERYGGLLPWSVFVATEEPHHPTLQQLSRDFSWLRILHIDQEDKGFLDSRLAAVEKLPSTFEFVFPIQEDFLLEARPLTDVLMQAIDILDVHSDVQSLRVMPCPGPSPTSQIFSGTQWKVLDSAKGDMLFSYQATFWRRSTYSAFLHQLISPLRSMQLTEAQRKRVEIQDNIAEISAGQKLLESLGGFHLAWPREGSQPNAVYLSPWPYRPTAIVRGKIEHWAEELADRERVALRDGPSLR